MALPLTCTVPVNVSVLGVSVVGVVGLSLPRQPPLASASARRTVQNAFMSSYEWITVML